MDFRKNETNKRNENLSYLRYGCISGELNFVFGEAHLRGSIAAIYLARLKQEFYDLESNELVFYDRVTKEAIHELGHSFGLFHCNNKKCVMHFSNSLYDTDFKNKIFCKNCKKFL